jgi:DNA-binding NtrC family response regulator
MVIHTRTAKSLLQTTDNEATQEAHMEILIVDDEPQVAEVLARSLAREGHSAKIANSGEEALRLLVKSEPDALFLDVSMPGMNGLDVLSQVKRMRPSLPVVVITGHATPDEVAEVKRLGAVDVIAKPAPLTHYQQALRRLDPPKA